MTIVSQPHQPRPLRVGLTLLEVTVVLLVLLTLVAGLFFGVQGWKKGSDRAGCIMTIRNTQQAMRAFENTNELPEGESLSILADLVGPDKYLKAMPLCPSTGIYTQLTFIPPIGTLVMTCSLEDTEEHSPATHHDW